MGTPPQAHTAFASAQYSDGVPPPQPGTGPWNQAGLVAALNQLSLQGSNHWVLDTGASTHMSPSDGILLSRLPHSDSFITVGNGSNIPTSCRGTSTLSAANTTFQLNNVLIAPALVWNLLSVRQFTSDNSCSIEFDALCFSVKDLQTGRVILRCNSGKDLYTITPTPPPTCNLATSATLWHHHLGHPCPSALATLQNMSVISCNKQPQSLCHAR